MGTFDKMSYDPKYWDLNRIFISKYNPYIQHRIKTASKFKGGKTLEIGCGIFPVDEDSTLIDVSKSAIYYLLAEGRKPVFCDARKLSFRACCFDTVFMLEVLEHLPDYEIALKEIFRVLKPGGKLILSIPVYEKNRNLLDTIWGHVYRFDPVKISKKLEKIGFSVKHRQVLIGHSYTIFKKIAAFLLNTIGNDLYYDRGTLTYLSRLIYLLAWPLYPLVYLESKVTPISLAEDILFVAQK